MPLNVEAWGNMWERTFVKAASEDVIECIILTELSTDDTIKVTDSLGLKMTPGEHVGTMLLVGCSQKDIVRLAGAIRYDNAPGITSAGPNRTVHAI